MLDTPIFDYLMDFHSMDAVLVCAMSGKTDETASVIDANETALDLLGYSREELIGMRFPSIAPGIPVSEVLIEEGQKRITGDYLDKNGKAIPIEMDVHPTFTGGSIAWLIVTRDLTNRKQMERDLEQARMETEDACEVKSRFLANMSHELRTPLNGIMGMTQILLGSNLTNDQKEYLNLSLDATRQLTRILNDLLELSSIEAGGLTLSPTTFRLRDMVEKLTRPIAVQAGKKGLDLVCDIDDAVPDAVYGDVGKIRQVLANLLINAVKFTESGTIALSVTGKGESCFENNECEVSFIVSDTGVGIDQKQIESIFDSFTLGESILTKQYGGIGLGLSISKQLTEFMCGTISVDSAPGQGATFTFTVPLHENTECVSEVPLQTAPDRPDMVPPLSILLAEDEQVNSIMASRLLRKAGHEVAVVGNGQEAMEALGKNAYDLILMDVQMPVINGIQATRFIRSGAVENVSTDIPIIGLTAFARPAEKRQFMEAGMNRIVTKPYEPEELMQAVATSTSAG